MNFCNFSNADISVLGAMENQIERNLEAIRTRHLYRTKAESFDEWLRQRFNLVPADQKGGEQ